MIDIQTIVHLYRSGDYSRRGIARKLDISRTTVDKVLAQYEATQEASDNEALDNLLTLQPSYNSQGRKPRRSQTRQPLKYKFNNGFIAMSDIHAACMNFINALEKIPGIIAQYEERTAKLKADVPQLEAIVAKSWGKEEELKQLKSDLAALDRKITAALAPKKEEQDGEENKQQSDIQRGKVRDDQSPTNGSKESMVAELSLNYKSDYATIKTIKL